MERANAAMRQSKAFFDLGVRLKFDPDTPAKGGHGQGRENASYARLLFLGLPQPVAKIWASSGLGLSASR